MAQIFDRTKPIVIEAARLVEFDGQAVDAAVQLVMKLMPWPMVAIEFSGIPEVAQHIMGGNEVCIARLELNGQVSDLDVMGQSYSPGTDAGTLQAINNYNTVYRGPSSIQAVDFKLINFWDFVGRMSRGSDGITRWNAARIQAPPWVIDLVGEPDIKDIIKSIKLERGYGVTHRGQIRRSDGLPFSDRDVEPILKALELFLSFARGSWCSLNFVQGSDSNGLLAWLRWSSRYVTPWNQNSSWLTTRDGGLALESFRDFWTLYQQGDWNMDIDWYLIPFLCDVTALQSDGFHRGNDWYLT